MKKVIFNNLSLQYLVMLSKLDTQRLSPEAYALYRT